jgi:molybdopterin/thiamine biosynthesis adenylyltransferase
VLCVGAGGLGSPVAMYLAAAGVGTLGILDFDRVDLTNLQRQLLHDTDDVGRPKVDSAAERLSGINPEVNVIKHDTVLTSANAFDILGQYDIVVDGTDNFPVRYLVNDATQILGKPLVYGSIYQFDGQASVFMPGRNSPCYRCLFPEPPPPGTVPSCAEGGVFGVLPGIVGSIQAVEAIKLVTGAGAPLVGKLLLFDALEMEFTTVNLRWDPDCPVCGENPTVTELIDYDQFCGLSPGAAPPEAEHGMKTTVEG